MRACVRAIAAQASAQALPPAACMLTLGVGPARLGREEALAIGDEAEGVAVARRENGVGPIGGVEAEDLAVDARGVLGAVRSEVARVVEAAALRGAELADVHEGEGRAVAEGHIKGPPEEGDGLRMSEVAGRGGGGW